MGQRASRLAACPYSRVEMNGKRGGETRVIHSTTSIDLSTGSMIIGINNSYRQRGQSSKVHQKASGKRRAGGELRLHLRDQRGSNGTVVHVQNYEEKGLIITRHRKQSHQKAGPLDGP